MSGLLDRSHRCTGEGYPAGGIVCLCRRGVDHDEALFDIPADPTPAQVLACPMVDEDSGVDGTVGDYLVKLLETLWAEDEGFSGKRPFGNSGWQADVYKALRAGDVIGDDLATIDEDGYIEYPESRPLDRIILNAIRAAALAPREA